VVLEVLGEGPRCEVRTMVGVKDRLRGRCSWLRSNREGRVHEGTSLRRSIAQPTALRRHHLELGFELLDPPAGLGEARRARGSPPWLAASVEGPMLPATQRSGGDSELVTDLFDALAGEHPPARFLSKPGRVAKPHLHLRCGLGQTLKKVDQLRGTSSPQANERGTDQAERPAVPGFGPGIGRTMVMEAAASS
jgi:hypothetical protein